MSEAVGRLRQLTCQAKHDVHRIVVLLDLTLQHARGVSRLISDPAAKAAFDLHLASIEDALCIARDRAAEL